MANVIQLKVRAAGGGPGAPSSLAVGEPAVNEDSDILYIGKTGGTVVVFGGLGAFVSLSTTQTITGNKTFNGTVGGAGFDTAVLAKRLDQFAAPAAAVSLNNQRITNLATPVAMSDAATAQYVRDQIDGLGNKGTVRVASTANVTISNPGTATFDGVALSNGDLILLKDQSTAAQNGIYVFNGSSSAMTRATNADTTAEVAPGMFVFVSEGTTQGNNGYQLFTDGPITLGTTALNFQQTSGAGQITAGAGLTKTGNTLDVVGTANRITANTDSIDIAATYVGQTSITTLGTVTTGSWASTLAATGGTIDNTAIGNTTRSTGKFTALEANGGVLSVVSAAVTPATSSSSVCIGAIDTGESTLPKLLFTHAGGTVDARRYLMLLGAGTFSTFVMADNMVTGSNFQASRVTFDATTGITGHQWWCAGLARMQLTPTGLNSTVIGATTPAAGTFTTVTCSTLDGATINGGTF